MCVNASFEANKAQSPMKGQSSMNENGTVPFQCNMDLKKNLPLSLQNNYEQYVKIMECIDLNRDIDFDNGKPLADIMNRTIKKQCLDNEATFGLPNECTVDDELSVETQEKLS